MKTYFIIICNDSNRIKKQIKIVGPVAPRTVQIVKECFWQAKESFPGSLRLEQWSRGQEKPTIILNT